MEYNSPPSSVEMKNEWTYSSEGKKVKVKKFTL